MAASAASRVFAIPELLETILLYLDPYADPVQLFQLLRVARTFYNTIVGSHELRVRMLIDNASPGGDGNEIHLSTFNLWRKGNPLLLYRAALFAPFKFISSCQIEVPLDDLRCQSHPVETRLERLPISRAGSWRLMKVLKNAPCPIMICLEDSPAQYSVYRALEIMTIEPEDTLGDLADKLVDVVKRELLNGLDQRQRAIAWARK